jgi:hypothetical protein
LSNLFSDQILGSPKVFVVVLVVALLITNEDVPISSGRSHAHIFSLLLNQYFVIVVESADARCAVVIALLTDSI